MKKVGQIKGTLKMAEMNPNIQAITVNINGLNSLLRRKETLVTYLRSITD